MNERFSQERVKYYLRNVWGIPEKNCAKYYRWARYQFDRRGGAPDSWPWEEAGLSVEFQSQWNAVLIDQIQKATKLDRDVVVLMVKAYIGFLKGAFRYRTRVSFRGFGTFTYAAESQRAQWVPYWDGGGRMKLVAAKRTVRFRPSRGFKGTLK